MCFLMYGGTPAVHDKEAFFLATNVLRWWVMNMLSILGLDPSDVLPESCVVQDLRTLKCIDEVSELGARDVQFCSTEP